MDFSYAPEDEAFRSELRTRLEHNLPEFIDQGDIGPRQEDSTIRTMQRRQACQRRLNEGRWAAIPMILRWGTDEQKHRWLPGILNADAHWCQGFSEPEAGRDLANLRTEAVRRGAKHEGITALIVDMDLPGVDCQPIRDVTWERMFNQVTFTDDAAAPVEYRLGDEGSGWRGRGPRSSSLLPRR